MLIRAMPWVFVVIWSTGFVVARLGMPHGPPMKFLVVRFALSALAFVVWVRLARAAWPRDRWQWLHLAITGALMQAAYLGGVWSAVKAGIGAGTVSLLVGLQPVLTAIWVSGVASHSARAGARTGSGTRAAGVSARQWFGLALGLAGLALVVWPKLGSGEVTPTNFALAVVALLGITTGTLYQKRFVAPCDVRTASTVQMLAAFVICAPLALLETETLHWHADLVIAMAWSVGALTLGGSSLLYLLIQRGEATRVTSVLYLVPPCTAAMAWAMFREPFTVPMAVGMALTVFGVAAVVRDNRRSTDPTRAEPAS